MERINSLIDKLCALKASNANFQDIASATRLLHQAVEAEVVNEPLYSTRGSVSVWMPKPAAVQADADKDSPTEPYPQPKPEPFPQPDQEPFPQPAPEPFPNPDQPNPGTPDPYPQPEPTILPPDNPVTPIRLSFGVPRPPQQIFAEPEAFRATEEEKIETVQHFDRPQAETSMAEAKSIEEVASPEIVSAEAEEIVAAAPERVVETISEQKSEPEAEPAIQTSVSVQQPQMPETWYSTVEEGTNAEEDILEKDHQPIVPPVIDWKHLAASVKTKVVPVAAENDVWNVIAEETQAEKVISRSVTPKEISIDSKTLSDIDRLVKGNDRQTASATKPVELNERLAQRTRVLNENFGSINNGNAAELAEVLSGPKIADLRKAISINEKYQYINNLFRGEEDMFERSVKTINNFKIMAEADYWVQRELVIKLGWNPDDELAQKFYSLVKRRFA